MEGLGTLLTGSRQGLPHTGPLAECPTPSPLALAFLYLFVTFFFEQLRAFSWQVSRPVVLGSYAPACKLKDKSELEDSPLS